MRIVLAALFLSIPRRNRSSDSSLVNGGTMQIVRQGVVGSSLFVLLLLLPPAVFAQASISGTVKDTSGAVLPGVNVEAKSDVLIEKVRTAVTDGSGRYQLLDLRPGAYVVTFTLQGFNSVKREGITLSGSANAEVNADLRVGQIEETVTVTGETPIVDTRSTTRQAVLSADVIDALPTSRNFVTLARIVPGTSGGGNDVGGSVLQDVGAGITVRGSNANDTRITLNGISVMTLQAGGSLGGQQPDPGSASEIAIDTSSFSADMPTGGPRINFIPRDGGNRFADSGVFSFSNSNLQGTNYSDALKAAGLPAPARIVRNWDLSESFGGPIKKDQLWFWFSTHFNNVQNEQPVLTNANAYDPTKWLYVPVDGQPAITKGDVQQSSLRVTWQASPRNKIAGTYKLDRWANYAFGVGVAANGAVTTAEAGRDRRFPRLRQEHLEWTSPVTDHLMLEAVGMHLFERWGNMDLRSESNGGSLTDQQAAAVPSLISVFEQSKNMTYRAAAGPSIALNLFNNTLVPNFAYRFGVSYITGSHAIKGGVNRTHGYLSNLAYTFQPFQYQFNLGVPNLVRMYATPLTTLNNEDNDLGLYVQDRWTLNRFTINGAVRYDNFSTSFPEQHIGPAPLVPNRNLDFPAQQNLGWNDFTYRSGFSYDLTGKGKTAVKVSMNKYLLGQTLNGLGSTPNPINTLQNVATRSWDDRGGRGINGDYIPQCNFLNPVANGECGPTTPSTFGTALQPDLFDSDLLRGWGHRQYNWEFTANVQHEVLPRVSVDVGYFRRIWGNFQVTDNVRQAPADFTTFNMTVPTDPRLPNSAGTVTLVNVSPDKVAAVQNYNTLSEKYGTQIEHWNGYEVSVNARPRNGLMLQLAVGGAKQIEDNCEIVAQLPELNLAAGTWRPTQYCHRESPMLNQLKAFGVYTVPKVDVQVSGSLRNIPGVQYNANFVATNAYLATNSSLGRLLAGTTAPTQNITVALVAPNNLYLDRRNELDMRFGKIFRSGRMRSIVSLDLYNMFNIDTPIAINEAYASWLQPTTILNPRLAKISVQFDF